jgi:hypothetical protein
LLRQDIGCKNASLEDKGLERVRIYGSMPGMRNRELARESSRESKDLNDENDFKLHNEYVLRGGVQTNAILLRRCQEIDEQALLAGANQQQSQDELHDELHEERHASEPARSTLNMFKRHFLHSPVAILTQADFEEDRPSRAAPEELGSSASTLEKLVDELQRRCALLEFESEGTFSSLKLQEKVLLPFILTCYVYCAEF